LAVTKTESPQADALLSVFFFICVYLCLSVFICGFNPCILE